MVGHGPHLLVGELIMVSRKFVGKWGRNTSRYAGSARVLVLQAPKLQPLPVAISPGANANAHAVPSSNRILQERHLCRPSVSTRVYIFLWCKIHRYSGLTFPEWDNPDQVDNQILVQEAPSPVGRVETCSHALCCPTGARCASAPARRAAAATDQIHLAGAATNSGSAGAACTLCRPQPELHESCAINCYWLHHL